MIDIGFSIPVPVIALVIAVILFMIGAAAYVLLIVFVMQIPDVFAQLKGQITKRALVLMHYSNRRAQFFAPAREGEKHHKNTLSFPKALGTKFDASGHGLEEVIGKSVMYNYYSKACHPVPAEHAKAVHDFREYCGERGIAINEELIDVLFVEDLDIRDVYTAPLLDKVLKSLPLPIRTPEEAALDEGNINYHYDRLTSEIEKVKDSIKGHRANKEQSEQLDALEKELDFIQIKRSELDKLNKAKETLRDAIEKIDHYKAVKQKMIDDIDIMTGYLDTDTRERIYTLTRMKDELSKRVIRDGTYVYPKVHEFIFAASSLNSAGMSEAISIAEADAHQQNLNPQSQFPVAMIFIGIMGVIILFIGLACGYKIMFG